MIESKLCGMKGGREKMVSAPGVNANRGWIRTWEVEEGNNVHSPLL